MESTVPSQDPFNAGAELANAERVRGRLTEGLSMPRGMYPMLAAGVAIQVGAAAFGIAEQTVQGLGIVLAGLGLFLAVAALSLHRFRLANGVRVDGLSSQVILAAGSTTSFVYLGSFAAATWAAFDSAWWMVTVAAVAGGVGYAFAARQWWRSYQADPAGHAGGVSPRQLTVLAAIAGLGFVVLLVVG